MGSVYEKVNKQTIKDIMNGKLKDEIGQLGEIMLQNIDILPIIADKIPGAPSLCDGKSYILAIHKKRGPVIMINAEGENWIEYIDPMQNCKLCRTTTGQINNSFNFMDCMYQLKGTNLQAVTQEKVDATREKLNNAAEKTADFATGTLGPALLKGGKIVGKAVKTVAREALKVMDD